MPILETSNRTFNKKVKTLIVKELNKVVYFKKVNNKTVRLMGVGNTTIAIWKQTKMGSEVFVMSDY